MHTGLRHGRKGIQKIAEYADTESHSGGTEVVAAFPVHAYRTSIHFEILSAATTPGYHMLIFLDIFFLEF
jgi:hypothetical protein